MKNLKQFIKANFIYIATFCCIFIAIEMMRVPTSYSTIVRILTQSPSQYPIDEVLVQLLVVIGDSLVLSLPALFVNKKIWPLYVWILLISAGCNMQVLYFREYQDFMPITHFLLFNNVNGILLKSAAATVQARDIIFYLPLAVFVVSTKILKCKKAISKPSLNKKTFIPVSFIFLIAACAISNINVSKYDKRGDRSLLYNFIAPNNNTYFITNNGVVTYFFYSAISSLPSWGISEEEKTRINDFINGRKDYHDNTYAINGKKNLIIIVVESFNSWHLNRTVCGMEIMPNLNRMLKEKGTVSALKVLPQVKDGRSSDGQFICNTGLLPLKMGSVAVSYSGNEFPSIAKALKRHGYGTYNMMCDDAKCWSQGKLSDALGYDKLYDCYTYGSGELLADSVMLGNALKELKQYRQPFLMQLVTISTHLPGYAPQTPTRLSDYDGNQSIVYTLEDFHLLDKALGNFIKGLKDSGIYDNSVVIIVSDHDEVGLNEFEKREERIPSDRYCTFIALNTTQTLSYDKVIGQVDIYPTILDIMGCNDYYWKGLGHSIFRKPQPDCATHCVGMEAGNPQSPLLDYYRRAWDISTLIIRGNYFKDNN